MKVCMNCERLFLDGGPFYHLHTKPLETDLLFRTPEEMNLALNMLALATCESTCSLLAFAIMNNHLHFVLEGKEEDCLKFYFIFQNRLAKCYRLERRMGLVLAAEPSLVPIGNLKQLRDEIVYVIRNPFVVSNQVHVFAYPWSSGHLYFNPMLDFTLRAAKEAKDLTVRERRAFKRERDASIDSRIRVLDGVALPASFTDFPRAMSFYENARQFVHWTLKNIESQVDIAARMGEDAHLDDMELWNMAVKLCRDVYKTQLPKDLGDLDRTRLLATLKYQYHASNSQLARCLRISPDLINAIFPLSAK